MESLFVQISDNVYISLKMYAYDWFCDPGSNIVNKNENRLKYKNKNNFKVLIYVFIFDDRFC